MTVSMGLQSFVSRIILDNRMVYVKREEVELSQAGNLFVEVMQEYFNQKRKS